MPHNNAHATDDTGNLRDRVPRWGILFDPLESVWVAVRGERTLVAAGNTEKLAEQVEAAARGPLQDPDMAYPPQAWAGPAAAGGGIAT